MLVSGRQPSIGGYSWVDLLGGMGRFSKRATTPDKARAMRPMCEHKERLIWTVFLSYTWLQAKHWIGRDDLISSDWRCRPLWCAWPRDNVLVHDLPHKYVTNLSSWNPFYLTLLGICPIFWCLLITMISSTRRLRYNFNTINTRTQVCI
jgi:hypothetical protein